jgi:hypothetical protein
MREAYRRFRFVHVLRRHTDGGSVTCRRGRTNLKKTHLATGASCTHDLDSNIFEVYEIIRAIGSRFLRER